MFLKIMSDENLVDHHGSKSYRIIECKHVRFFRDDPEQKIGAPFAAIVDESGSEQIFYLHGNAYVLSNSGKTIDSYAHHSPIKDDAQAIADLQEPKP